MGFSKKIKYFLVHSLKFSNKAAQELIDSGEVEIDGQTIRENCSLNEASEIKVRGTLVREQRTFVYLKFYKPRGFESSLNTRIESNLFPFFQEYSGLAIAGRLDKDSEGLLLLSNDGKWVENLCNPKFEKEKEYLVLLNRPPDEAFLNAFRSGVKLGEVHTAPCICEALTENRIRVILKEGKNRQIRRMCRKLGYSVLELKRVRIDQILLGELVKGESQEIENILYSIDNQYFTF